MTPVFESVSPDGPLLEIWPNPGADAILFYPGTMLEPGHYRLVLECLWQAGLAVACPHLPGHGLRQNARNFTFSSLLEDGLACERWLLAHNFATVAVSGHSQGGILALAHGAQSRHTRAAFPICAVFPQEPEAIRLTRFGPAARWRDVILANFRLLADKFPNFPIPLPVYLQLHKITRGKKKPILIGPGKGRLSYPAKMLYSLFTTTIPTVLHCPVWLFSAKDDALFTQDIIESTFAKIEAPEKSLVLLPQGGHLAPFNQCLAQYLARYIASCCASAGMAIHTCMEI